MSGDPTYEEFLHRVEQVKLEETQQKLVDELHRDPGFPFRDTTIEWLAEERRNNLASYHFVRGIFARERVPVRDLDTALDRFDSSQGKPNGSGQPPLTPLVGVPSTSLLAMKIPERRVYMSPWIAAQSISMVFASRGTGKTFFLMSTALALASGTPFLGWEVSAPRKVLYVEGELPLASLQDRCRLLGTHDNLTIINPELQPDLFLPHLATEEAQTKFDPLITEHDVTILDSLSTLAPCSFEKDSENWAQLQPWFLAIRRRGKALIFSHHTNRAGTQRGISNREDVLDFVLKLEREGEDKRCKFRLNFTKTRQFDTKADADKLFAALDVELRDGEWSSKPEDKSVILAVADLTLDGKTIRKIADELGVAKSTVNRLQKEARARGLL